MLQVELVHQAKIYANNWFGITNSKKNSNSKNNGNNFTLNVNPNPNPKSEVAVVVQNKNNSFIMSSEDINDSFESEVADIHEHQS